MRHVFHEILARYLDNQQHAFDPTWREFWPDTRASWHPPVEGKSGSQLPRIARRQQDHGELEPNN